MLSVFIFGAGASVEAGAPLMKDFVDKAEWLYRRSNFQEYDLITNDFEIVFENYKTIWNLYSKTHVEIKNIENLFCLIEMACLIGKLGDFEQKTILEIRKALVNVIIRTIEMNMKFEIKNSFVHSAASYGYLLQILSEVNKKTRIGHKYSFITFNYDIGLESAILKSPNYNGINYYLDNSIDISSADVLKLHGSINWGKCENNGCNYVQFPDWNRFFCGGRGREEKDTILPISKYFEENPCIKCNAHGQFTKLIIPPTWNKIFENELFAKIWNKSISLLSKATNIFVIGYSMPETDLFFKYMITLGLFKNDNLRKFVVVNPDCSVDEKYKNILSKGVIENNYLFVPKEFRPSIQDIQNILDSF